MSIVSNEPLSLSEHFESRRGVFKRLEDFFRQRSPKTLIQHREFHTIASWIDQCAVFAPAHAPLFAKYREELTVKPSLFESRSFFDPRLPGLPELPKSIGPVYTVAGSPIAKAKQYLELMSKCDMTLEDVAKNIAAGQNLFSQALLPKYQVGSLPVTAIPGSTPLPLGLGAKRKPFLRRSEVDAHKISNPIAKRSLATPAPFDHHKLVQKLQSDLEKHQDSRFLEAATCHSSDVGESLAHVSEEPPAPLHDTPLGIVSKLPSTLMTANTTPTKSMSKRPLESSSPNPHTSTTRHMANEPQHAKASEPDTHHHATEQRFDQQNETISRQTTGSKSPVSMTLPFSSMHTPLATTTTTTTTTTTMKESPSKNEQWETIAAKRRKQFKCSYGLEMALSFTDDEIQAYEATLTSEELYRRRHSILTESDKKLLENHVKYLDSRREQQRVKAMDEKISYNLGYASGQRALDVAEVKPPVPTFLTSSFAQKEREKSKSSDRSWLSRICAKMDELKEEERRKEEQLFLSKQVTHPITTVAAPIVTLPVQQAATLAPSNTAFTGGFPMGNLEPVKTEPFVTLLTSATPNDATAASSLMPKVNVSFGALKDTPLSSVSFDTMGSSAPSSSSPFSFTGSKQEPTAASLSTPSVDKPVVNAAPAFTFDAMTAPSTKEAVANTAPTPSFSFGSNTSAPSTGKVDMAQTSAPFSFGSSVPSVPATSSNDAAKSSFDKYASSVKSVFETVPYTALTATSQAPTATASASAPTPTPAPTSTSTSTSTSTAATQTPTPTASVPAFTFGTNSSFGFGSQKETPPAASNSISHQKTTFGLQPASTPASSLFSSAASPSLPPTDALPRNSFNFGTTTTTSAAATGAPLATVKPAATPSAFAFGPLTGSSTSAFSFGSSTSVPSIPSGAGSEAASKQSSFGSSSSLPFTFNAPSVPATPAVPATPSVFGSSTSTSAPVVPALPAAPFAFGSSTSATPFSFGSSTTAAPAPPYAPGSSTSAPAAPATPFSFGSSSTPAFQFGGSAFSTTSNTQPSPSAFSFGAPNPSAAASSDHAPNAPFQFTMGSSAPSQGDRKFTKPVSRKKR